MPGIDGLSFVGLSLRYHSLRPARVGGDAEIGYGNDDAKLAGTGASLAAVSDFVL